MGSRFEGDVLVTGRLIPVDFSPPAGSITAAAIPAGAGIEASKLEGEYSHTLSQTGNATAATEYVRIFRAAGQIVSVEAALCETIPSGDHTVTVDLKKSTAGGAFASVLSAAITLDSGNTVRVPEAGTITSEDTVDGDILQLVVATGGSSGTNPQGVTATVVYREDAS